MFYRTAIFTILILAGAGFAFGQEPGLAPDSTIADSLKPSLTEDDINLEYHQPFYVHQTEDSAYKKPSPTKTLFKSMLIPGWGQLGNRKYVKATLIIGLESVLIGAIVHYADKSSEAKKAFDAYVSPDSTDRDKQLLYDAYRDARSERNKFGWFLGTTIFFSMFDAFVDAHLSDFPKKESELSLHFEQEQIDHLAIKLTWTF